MAKKYHGRSKMYTGYDNGRSMEKRDSGMLSEDRSAVANLPQDVIVKQYPRCPYGLDSYLDDTMSGIDKQIGSDDGAARRNRSKSKY